MERARARANEQAREEIKGTPTTVCDTQAQGQCSDLKPFQLPWTSPVNHRHIASSGLVPFLGGDFPYSITQCTNWALQRSSEASKLLEGHAAFIIIQWSEVSKACAIIGMTEI
eukprot:1140553-Pelagomonas_calceolata.AAC.9